MGAVLASLCLASSPPVLSQWETMNIGDAAGASGVSAKMIRYYEAIGLIGRIERNGANYRSYSETEVRTLRFLRRARDLGFSVPQMRELLLLWRDGRRASADVKRLALAHAAVLDHKAAEIASMSRALHDLANDCADDARPDCAILDELAAAGAATSPRARSPSRSR